MYGISGIIAPNAKIELINNHSQFAITPQPGFLSGKFRLPQAVFFRSINSKFPQDKIFFQDHLTTVLLDGVVLNSKDIMNEFHIPIWQNIFNDTNQPLAKLISKFRGNFCGMRYSQEQHSLEVFTDHLAAKPIYYFHSNEVFIFSSNLYFIVTAMRLLGIHPHFNQTAAYSMLTFGYMLGNVTLVEDIKKLPAGHILTFKENRLHLEQFYQIDSESYVQGSKAEIIEGLHDRFTTAIRQEYRKDEDYGYNHLTTLSGGLDSRMNIGYAINQGFKNISSLTFSESNYDDDKIARKISHDFHLPYIFFPLDTGTYLTKYIDEIVEANNGLVLYGGSAHMYNALKSIDFSPFGLVHTGMVGDLIVGSYLQNKVHTPVNQQILLKSAYSIKLIDKIGPDLEETIAKYPNSEMFAFYEKCINAVFNGFRITEQFTEFSSPFLHVDFLDYAMRIHPELRYKQRIYLEWMNQRLPNFSKYPWEKYGLVPRYPLFFMEWFAKFRDLEKTYLKPRRVSMNPTDYWLKSNPLLSKTFDRIFEHNIQILREYNFELGQDTSNFFQSGTTLEKIQVLTLLLSYRRLFRG